MVALGSDHVLPDGWNVRVTSYRSLVGSLRELLVGRGYVLRSAPAEPAVSGVFTSEVLAEKDWPRRDAAYLGLGIALLPTLLLTSLGLNYIRQSRYTFRTVAGISVNGMTETCPDAGSGDAAADVRIVLHVETGPAREGGGIWRPINDRSGLARLADERSRLEQDIVELLRSMQDPS